jgi:hypothetical protein
MVISRITNWIIGGWRLFIGHPALWVLVAGYFLYMLADRAINRVSIGYELLFSTLVGLPLFVGIYIATLNLARTGRLAPWQIDMSFNKIWNFVLAGIIIFFFIIISMLLVMIPIIGILRVLHLHHSPTMRIVAVPLSSITTCIFLTRYIFVYPLIIEKGLRFWEAMKVSKKNTQGNFIPLLLLNLICVGISMGIYYFLNPSNKKSDALTIAASASYFWNALFMVLWGCITISIYCDFWPKEEPASPQSTANQLPGQE